MIRRPPRSTRTVTLLPYTTLFRSLAFNVGQPRNGPLAEQHLRTERPKAKQLGIESLPQAFVERRAISLGNFTGFVIIAVQTSENDTNQERFITGNLPYT